jgi:hypothetical protein
MLFNDDVRSKGERPTTAQMMEGMVPSILESHWMRCDRTSEHPTDVRLKKIVHRK